MDVLLRVIGVVGGAVIDRINGRISLYVVIVRGERGDFSLVVTQVAGSGRRFVRIAAVRPRADMRIKVEHLLDN